MVQKLYPSFQKKYTLFSAFVLENIEEYIDTTCPSDTLSSHNYAHNSQDRGSICCCEVTPR